ncbi:P-loop containing nucleoside triphosphate hydrolase protein [Apiospora saccharicola]
MSGRSQHQPHQIHRQRAFYRSPDDYPVPPGSPNIPALRDVEAEVERLALVNDIGQSTADVVRAFCAYMREDLNLKYNVEGTTPKTVEQALRAVLYKATVCSKMQDCVTYLEICRNDHAKSDARIVQFVEKHDNAIQDHIKRETEKEAMKQKEWQRFNDLIEYKFEMLGKLIEGDEATNELKKKASQSDMLQNKNSTLQQLLDEATAAVKEMHRETEAKTSEIRKLQGELQGLSNGDATVAPLSLASPVSPGRAGVPYSPKSPREREANQNLLETQRSLIDANKRADQKEKALRDAAQEAESLRQDKANLEAELRQVQDTLKEDLENTRDELRALKNVHRQGDEKLTKKLAKSLEANAKLYEELCDAKGSLRVMTRVRPLLDADAGEEVEYFDTERTSEGLGKVQSVGIPDYRHWSIPAQQRGEEPKIEYYGDFEHVFDKQAANADVFDEVKPVIGTAFNGKKACIFAYGQSGSGKTHTLGTAAMAATPEEGGIIPRSLGMLAQWISSRKDTWSYTVHAQFLEIYSEKVYDLLAGTREEVKIKVEPVPGTKQTHHYADCSSREVTRDDELDMDEVAGLLDTAAKNRRVRSTVKNDQSSRSHSILTLRVVGTHRTEGAENGQPRRTEGVVNLVDLAGSEKFDMSADKTSTIEGTQINLSLSVLRKVIEQMGNPKATRTSFRESMLTKLLEPCLGNGSKVIMLAMVSPLKKDYDETKNTLKFAKEAKSAKMQTIRGPDNLTRSPTLASASSSSASSPSHSSRSAINRTPRIPVPGGAAAKSSPVSRPPLSRSGTFQQTPPRLNTGVASRSRITSPGSGSARTPQSSSLNALKSTNTGDAQRYREEREFSRIGRSGKPPAPLVIERDISSLPLSPSSFRERIASAQGCHDNDDYPPVPRPKTPTTPTSESRVPRPTSKLGRRNAVRRPSTASGPRRETENE